MTEAQCYIAGWKDCMNGTDGRYEPEGLNLDQKYAYHHGWFDAMEAEDNEEPEPACHGYGPA